MFGGSGFLGSYIIDALLAQNYVVINVDINKPSIDQNCEFKQVDCMNIEQVMSLLNSSADIIYNFAGYSDLDESINHPKETIETNVLTNLNILQLATKINVSRYIYASSAYASSTKGAFYGISKLTCEKIIEEYQKQYDLSYTILRYGSLYGKRADKKNGIYRLLSQAVVEKKIKHFGLGEEIREYIHAKDAAKLSVDILNDNYINKHMILTGSEKINQKTLLLMIKEMLNDEIDIEFANKQREGHYKYTPYSHNPEQSIKLIANPFIDLGQGLIECIEEIYQEKKIRSRNESMTSV